MISASCWRKWIHKSEAALLFDPAPAPRLMLGVLSSHTLAKTPSEDSSSVRSVEMATFFFAFCTLEMKNVFLNSTFQGKKTYRVQEVLIKNEFGFSFLPSFPPVKKDIKTHFVFYNISCNKK